MASGPKRNKTPKGVNAGGEPTVKTSFIPRVRRKTLDKKDQNVMKVKRPDSCLLQLLNHCIIASKLSPK